MPSADRSRLVARAQHRASRFSLVVLVAALSGVGSIHGQAGAGARAACQRFGTTTRPLPHRATLTTPSFAPDSGALPARCVIRGKIVSSATSTINFRIDLPAPTEWNGKTLMIGGGGFDGVIPTDRYPWTAGLARMGLAPADAARFAVGSTDSGHQGRGALPFADYSWSPRNPTALLNHASEANHLVQVTMVAVVRAYYGKAPTKRFMFGVSNGGRQGLMAAQRHPDDYDGILALAPAISQTAFAANLAPIMRHVYSHPDNYLDRTQLALFSAAELAACDQLDGLQDGVISNDRGCRLDPGTLACPRTGEGGCLTAGQIETLRMWMGEKKVPVPMADGLTGYARYGPGGPLGDWTYLFGTGFAARDAFDFIAADNIVKTVSDDPLESVVRHEPERWAQSYLTNSELIDATSPDLSRFAARGGKLIVIHGVGDYCVSYERTGQWYRTVVGRMGAEGTRGVMRYYVAPSLGHGMTGAGADTFTLFPALEAWVAEGRAPEGQTAVKREAGGAPRFERPLCEYGRYPRYERGDQTKASSFTCSEY